MKNFFGSGNLKISGCNFFPRFFLLLSYYSVGFGGSTTVGQLLSATIMVGKKNHGVMNHGTKGTPQLQPGK